MAKRVKNYFILKILKSNVILLLIFSFIILLFCTIIIYEFYYYTKLMNDSKIIFSYINSYFSRKVFNIEILNIIQHYYDKNKLEQFYYENSQKEFEEELRKIIAFFQNKRETELKELILFFQIFIIILISFIFYILISNFKNIKIFDDISIFIKNFLNSFENFYIIKVNKDQSNFDLLDINPDSPICKYNEFNFIKENVNKISKIFTAINSALFMNPTMNLENFIDEFGKIVCSKQTKDFFKCDRFSICVFDSRTNNLIAYHAYKVDIENIKLNRGFTQKLNDTSLKDILYNNMQYRIINDLTTKDTISANLLKEEGIKSNLTIPIIINNKLFGFLFYASKEKNAYDENSANIGLMLSKLAKMRFFYSYAIQDSIRNLGDSIVNIVEFKDEETYNHILRVSLYSGIIADFLSEKSIIEPQKAREIKDFSPLHDIGKVGIPDSILLKPASLTSEEFEIMKKHTLIGYRIIENTNKNVADEIGFELLATASNLVLDHHENWNGTGYPNGKKGPDISIEGRIVAIADVFDALTSARPYKKPIHFDKSVEMMKNLSGIKFDPYLLDIFFSNMDEIYSIYSKYKDI